MFDVCKPRRAIQCRVDISDLYPFVLPLELKDDLCKSCKCSNHFENLQHKGNYLRQLKATQLKNSNFWQQMQKYVTFEMMTNSLQLKTNTLILDLMHHMVKREAKWP